MLDGGQAVALVRAVTSPMSPANPQIPDLNNLIRALRNRVLWLISGASAASFLLYLFALPNPTGPTGSVLLAISGSLFAAAVFTFATQATADAEAATLHAMISDFARLSSPDNCTVHRRKTPVDRIREVTFSQKRPHLTAMGLHLEPLEPILRQLAANSSATLHIILPDPQSEELLHLCRLEDRFIASVKKSIDKIVEIVSSSKTEAQCSIRFTSKPTSITIVRVDDVIFWRPRMHFDANADEDHVCFEVLALTNSHLFRVMKRELGVNWDAAVEAR